MVMSAFFKDIFPVQLPSSTINNHKNKREESTKFLGVLLDEHMSLKE